MPSNGAGLSPRPISRGWTSRQLELASPAVVVALGLSAARWLLGPGRLASLRGRLHVVHLPGVHLPGVHLPGADPAGSDPADPAQPALPRAGGLRVLATYHPSAALRHGPQGEPRRLLREDLALAVRASR